MRLSNAIQWNSPRCIGSALARWAALMALGMAASASADEQGYAFVLADQPTAASYRVTGSRAYNDAGGVITVTRSGVGAYALLFEDFDPAPTSGGHVQVSAVGSAATDCKVDRWLAIQVFVLCFDAAGSPTDSVFSVLYVRPSIFTSNLAYAWADQETTPLYNPNPSYAHNGNLFGSVEITRNATGRYRVEFPNFSSRGSGGGHVQVTAYGDSTSRCQVQSWGGDLAFVDCYGPTGAAVDSRFTVLFWRPEATDAAIAFAWANDATSALYAPDATYAFNPESPLLEATRKGTGHYEMTWPSFSTVGLGIHNVQVTAYGVTPALCQTDGWTSESATVRCFDSAGTPTDARYAVMLLKAIKTDWTPLFAFAFASEPMNPSYELTNRSDAWNPMGGRIDVTRGGIGRYVVDFERFDAIPGGGNVQASAVTSIGDYCNVESWTPRQVSVHCFDWLGDPKDAAFNLFYLKAHPGERSVGYAWGQFPFAGSYIPSASFSHSPTGQTILIERTGLGLYRVTWSDVFVPPGPSRPWNHQVTAYGSNAACGLVGESFEASTGRLIAEVGCTDSRGHATDAQFSALLLLPEPHHRSIGFARTIDGVLVPGSDFNSGDKPVVGEDVGAGLSRIVFDDLGPTGLGAGHLQSTAFPGAGYRCTPLDWTEEDAFVSCRDGNNTSVTIPSYSVMMVRRTAAPEPSLMAGLGGVLLALVGVEGRSRRLNRPHPEATIG